MNGCKLTSLAPSSGKLFVIAAAAMCNAMSSRTALSVRNAESTNAGFPSAGFGSSVEINIRFLDQPPGTEDVAFGGLLKCRFVATIWGGAWDPLDRFVYSPLISRTNDIHRELPFLTGYGSGRRYAGN